VKRRLAVLSVALVLAACTTEPTPPAPSSAPPEPPTEPTCPASGVRVTVGVEDAAMGLRVVGLKLTNCGEEPYRLDGYPAVRVFDAEGQPLDVRVRHGAEGIATIDRFELPPEPLTLQPGDVAETHLAWRNTDTSGGASAVGQTVEVAPEAGRPWQPVELDGRFPQGLHLDSGDTGTLGVSAWRR
jgi:hypothetical protein